LERSARAELYPCPSTASIVSFLNSLRKLINVFEPNAIMFLVPINVALISKAAVILFH